MGTYFRKVVGTNVYLSPVDPEDAPVFAGWLADTELTRYMTMAHRLYGVAVEREALTALAQGQDNFTIVDLATHRPLGACGFLGIDELNRRAEVGIFLGEKGVWGKGYGTEALRLLLDFGFSIRNFHNIMLRVKAFNTRALRSYEKVGFQRIGVRRECNLNGETYTDEVLMDLLATEFSGTLQQQMTR